MSEKVPWRNQLKRKNKKWKVWIQDHVARQSRPNWLNSLNNLIRSVSFEAIKILPFLLTKKMVFFFWKWSVICMVPKRFLWELCNWWVIHVKHRLTSMAHLWPAVWHAMSRHVTAILRYVLEWKTEITNILISRRRLSEKYPKCRFCLADSWIEVRCWSRLRCRSFHRPKF